MIHCLGIHKKFEGRTRLTHGCCLVIFPCIEVNVTKKQKDDYKAEIDFSEHDIPKKMNTNKLYNCFRSICDFKGGKYSLDKVKAGRLLFKIRKDEDKICAFFTFVLTLTHVYQDIDELR